MTGFIEKRTNKRVYTNQGVCIYSSGIIRLGTLINCSEDGMYIQTIIKRMTSFPLDSIFEIHVPLKGEELKILAKAVRLEQTDDFYEGMGVELLNMPQKYLEFVIRLNLCNYV